MRQRICKACGQLFEGEKDQRLCPECRHKARAATVALPRTCVQCGVVFVGGPRAQYCPDCRAERKKKIYAEYQQRKKAGKTRPLGSVDICKICGKEYIVNGGLQMYCPECAAEAVRQKVLPVKREWAAEHRAETKAKKKELTENSAFCAYCGKPYTPNGPSVTCSDECAREYKRIKMGIIDYKRGKRKTPPDYKRYSSGLPQSDMTGVNYHRKLQKWQVVHNGVYIGLYATREEAEAKKKELNAQPS